MLEGFQIFWYCIIIVSLINFSILDGFDLGVGILHPLAGKDEERRIFLNAIGPVWDGNAVWLIIIGGGLFAGFPIAFATIFSSFYDLVMILIGGIIFRAVSIEFRSKSESKTWRCIWDYLFFISSLAMTFGIGIILGNLVIGIPLDENYNFIGNFASYFSPFTIILGITTISLFMMHGSIFLIMKTEGELHERLRTVVKACIGFFFLCYIATTITVFVHVPHLLYGMFKVPWLVIFPILALLSILNVPRQIHKGKDGRAFMFSSLSIVFAFILFALGTFPLLVPSSVDFLQNSLTVYNASSSLKTLVVLLIIVAIGVPLVIGYSIYIYHIFRHRVTLDETSY